MPCGRNLKLGLTGCELLIGEWDNLLEAENDDIGGVDRVETFVQELRIFTDEVGRFSTVDIPSTDHRFDISESAVLRLTNYERLI